MSLVGRCLGGYGTTICCSCELLEERAELRCLFVIFYCGRRRRSKAADKVLISCAACDKIVSAHAECVEEVAKLCVYDVFV